MAHLTRPGSCGLCGEDLLLHPTEFEVLEGYKLTLEDLSRTDEDDEDDAAEPHRDADPTEMTASFCESCAPKIRIGIERMLKRKIESARAVSEKLDGGES